MSAAIILSLAALVLSLALRSRQPQFMSEAWLRRFVGETPHDGRARGQR